MSGVQKVPKEGAEVSRGWKKAFVVVLVVAGLSGCGILQGQFLDDLETRMRATLTHRMERTRDRLSSLHKRLEGCSLQTVLGKGFAYLQDEQGTILDRSKSLKAGSLISVTLKDGSKRVRVEKGGNAP